MAPPGPAPGARAACRRPGCRRLSTSSKVFSVPKHERAACRKKKRAKDVGKGGQGAGKVDNKLDVFQMEAKPAGVSL